MTKLLNAYCGGALMDEPNWLDEAAESALRSVIPHHMGGNSAALYARWWQIERWLRSLLYVDLRAKYGEKWIDTVKAANGRVGQDAAYTHMAGPDNDNPLAYLDYSQVTGIIEANWEIVGYALLDKSAWQGRQSELQRIRHRIGHMRRPHPDDLSRLEQTLRDLERGAFIAMASYNDRMVPSPDHHDDPVTQAWIQEKHRDAKRLVDHARRQYETSIVVSSSRRPWVARGVMDLREAPGRLWHADFISRHRGVDIESLWRDVVDTRLGQMLVHLEARHSHHVGFAFSARDDAHDLADVIGNAFDMVLSNRSFTDADEATWSDRARSLDYRIVADDGWTIVDETTVPISLFGAGAGVSRSPRW